MNKARKIDGKIFVYYQKHKYVIRINKVFIQISKNNKFNLMIQFKKNSFLNKHLVYKVQVGLIKK